MSRCGTSFDVTCLVVGCGAASDSCLSVHADSGLAFFDSVECIVAVWASYEWVGACIAASYYNKVIKG